MGTILDFAVIQKHFPDAREAGDGSIIFACPTCEAEGRPTRAKVFANGALSCPRAASISTEYNREHCRPLAEQLGITQSASTALVETIADGKYTLQALPAARGKTRIVTTNGTGTLHRDTLNLDDASKRAAYLKSLALQDAEEKEAQAALLRLAERLESVREAVAREPEAEAKEVSFIALSDGRIAEQLEGRRFAVYDGQQVTYERRLRDDAGEYLPATDKFLLDNKLKFPARVEEYGNTTKLDEEICAYLKRFSEAPEREMKLAAAMIRLSWIQDRLYECPYLHVTGATGSGKSRFAKLIWNLSYRPLLTVSVSESVIFRLCDQYHPTMLIDEFNPAVDSNDTKSLLQILNSGFQRGIEVWRSEKNADGSFTPTSFSVFGIKIFSGLKLTGSQAFESRTVPVHLTTTADHNIPFVDTGRMLAESWTIRAKLQLWRLRNYAHDWMKTLEETDRYLKQSKILPRYIQISAPLAMLLDDAALKKSFAESLTNRTNEAKEETQATYEGQIIEAVAELIFLKDTKGVLLLNHLPECGAPDKRLTLDAVLDKIKDCLPDRIAAQKEHSQKTWLGKQIKNLGLRVGQIAHFYERNKHAKAITFDYESLKKASLQYTTLDFPDFQCYHCYQSRQNIENKQDSNGNTESDSVSERDFSVTTASDVNKGFSLSGNTGNSEIGEIPGKEFAEGSLTASHLVALDTETERFDEKRGITPRTCRMIGLALSHNGEAAIYETDAEAWNMLMPEPEQTVLFHNAKFDLGVLSRTGLPIPQQWEDSLIAAHLLDENSEHGLKPLARQHLGIDDPLTFEDADRMRLLDPEVFHEYAKNDARYTYRLWQQFEPALQRQELLPVYKLEKDVLRAVIAMEEAGMKLDLSRMVEMAKAVTDESSRIEQEIYEHAGCRFDLNSPQKVAAILFDKLGVPSHKQTNGGQRSVDKEALEEVRGYHPAVDALLRFREIDKLASTFLNGLPKFADEAGRIHPEFKPLGAKTGRFRCSNPNVQQIPSRSELGKKLRQMFIAEEGHSLVVADWSQMELRILAHYCQDPLLLQAYASETETDLHTLTASRMFGKAEAGVTKQERDVAKMINFGIAYGITARGLFNRLKPAGINVTEEQCERFIDDYFKTYPKVRKFLNDVEKAVQKRGYVKSLYGRRRRVAGDTAREIRQAQNFVIQASAADLAKAAMVKLHQTLPEGARLIAMVHDEFLVECRTEQATKVKQLMEAVMGDTPDSFTVPMLVEAKLGQSWGECK